MRSLALAHQCQRVKGVYVYVFRSSFPERVIPSSRARIFFVCLLEGWNPAPTCRLVRSVNCRRYISFLSLFSLWLERHTTPATVSHCKAKIRLKSSRLESLFRRNRRQFQAFVSSLSLFPPFYLSPPPFFSNRYPLVLLMHTYRYIPVWVYI